MLDKCTPGDWNYVGDHVVGVVGDCECQTKPPEGDWVAYPTRAHESHDVVPPVFEDQLPEGVTMEEHMANCHLIAVSKLMYAKLEEVEKEIAEWPSLHEDGDYLHGWILNSIRALLAKARGEEKAK